MKIRALCPVFAIGLIAIACDNKDDSKKATADSASAKPAGSPAAAPPATSAAPTAAKSLDLPVHSAAPPPATTAAAPSATETASAAPAAVASAKPGSGPAHRNKYADVPGIFPELSKEPISQDDLKSYDCPHLSYARNEIYARQGYVFKTKEFADHFSKLSWYKPQNANVDSVLTGVEKANINKLLEQEKAKKCSTIAQDHHCPAGQYYWEALNQCHTNGDCDIGGKWFPNLHGCVYNNGRPW